MSPDCSVLFVAGGRSTRMGTPKPWLPFGGDPLLTLLVDRMLAVFPEAVVVGSPGQELPETRASRVDDTRPGEGPLAGLAAGFAAVTRPYVFVASCDLPFLSPGLARSLLDRASGYDAVVPEWQGRLNPLHAVYRTNVRPVLDDQLAHGRRRMTDLFPRLRLLIIPESEVRAADPSGLSLFNVNTPEDYATALRLWRQQFPGCTK